MNFPLASVIIPAFNAEKTISAVLAALRSQTYLGPLEVIVVDDGSTDRTAELVRECPGFGNTVRLVSQPNAGPAAARNRGAGEASGEFLMFTDSDCCPEPDWVAKVIRALVDEGAGVVAGSYGIANPESRLARIIHGEIRFRHLKMMPAHPEAFGSYNVAMRRALFQQAGGFNASYRRASGEDNDLSYKIVRSGATIRFLTDACVAHYHQTDLLKYLREQYRHGYWRALLYRDHPGMLKGDGYTFWKDMIEVPAVCCHGILLLSASSGAVFVLLFLIFEVMAGLVMVGVRDGVPAGMVMWLRSFCRTAGLVAGTGCFFSKKSCCPSSLC